MKQETLNHPPRLFKTTQDKEEFVFWIETLRAGVLPQGKHRLQSSDGYCCLGVGVVCAVANENIIYDDIGLVEGQIPIAQPHSPEWLKIIAKLSDGLYFYGPIDANDMGVSHAKIAEKLWQLYKWELED